MQRERFQTWLLTVKCKNKAQTSDNLSRVQRVENAFTEWLEVVVDMDEECKKDLCTRLMGYLNVQERNKIPSSINLPQNMTGLSTLKSAVKNYVEFYEWDQKSK